MPTRNPRLNVVLSKDSYGLVAKLAKLGGKSMSVVAKELMEDALERNEDLLLSELAMKRENMTKRTVSHAKAWK